MPPRRINVNCGDDRCIQCSYSSGRGCIGSLHLFRNAAFRHRQRNPADPIAIRGGCPLISPWRIHAVRWPSPVSTNGGTEVAQASRAYGHRIRKPHPVGEVDDAPSPVRLYPGEAVYQDLPLGWRSRARLCRDASVR